MTTDLYSSNPTLEYDESQKHRAARFSKICPVYAAGSLGLEVLSYIAEQDGSLNSDWDGNNGYLAIHAAVDTEDLEVVRAVVAAGADLHLSSNDGETALGLALDQENPGLVTYLLSQGASLDQSDYRTLDLDGEDPGIDDPRDHVRSKEMEMLIKQFM